MAELSFSKREERYVCVPYVSNVFFLHEPGDEKLLIMCKERHKLDRIEILKQISANSSGNRFEEEFYFDNYFDSTEYIYGTTVEDDTNINKYRLENGQLINKDQMHYIENTCNSTSIGSEEFLIETSNGYAIQSFSGTVTPIRIPDEIKVSRKVFLVHNELYSFNYNENPSEVLCYNYKTNNMTIHETNLIRKESAYRLFLSNGNLYFADRRNIIEFNIQSKETSIISTNINSNIQIVGISKNNEIVVSTLSNNAYGFHSASLENMKHIPNNSQLRRFSSSSSIHRLSTRARSNSRGRRPINNQTTTSRTENGLTDRRSRSRGRNTPHSNSDQSTEIPPLPPTRGQSYQQSIGTPTNTYEDSLHENLLKRRTVRIKFTKNRMPQNDKDVRMIISKRIGTVAERIEQSFSISGDNIVDVVMFRNIDQEELYNKILEREYEMVNEGIEWVGRANGDFRSLTNQQLEKNLTTSPPSYSSIRNQY